MHRTSLVSFLKYITLLGVSVVTLLELIGFFIFDGRYAWDQRYLSMSQHAIQNEESTDTPFWKYSSNSEIRTVATYADIFGAHIEYDCKFRSNEFGLTDTGSVEHPTRLLVLGDSFTDGQGGCPWLTASTVKSDPVLSHLNLLNGGRQGAGVTTFEAILNYLESKLIIEHVIIIAISNDFKRSDPVTWDTNNDCFKHLKCSGEDFVHFIPNGSSDAFLIEQALKRRKQKKTSIGRELQRYSFTYRVFQEYKNIVGQIKKLPKNKKGNASETHYQSNFNSIIRMHERYPNLEVILIPQRDEVGLLGRKNSDSQVVERFLSVNSVKHRWCNISADDYMPIDGHPNKQGYLKLFECLKASARTIDYPKPL